MAAGWFFQWDGRVYGPLSARQLREKADSGVLKNSTLVRKSGSVKWVEAAKVMGLFCNSATLGEKNGENDDMVADAYIETLPLVQDAPASGSITNCPSCEQPVTAEEKKCGHSGELLGTAADCRKNRTVAFAFASGSLGVVVGALCIALAFQTSRDRKAIAETVMRAQNAAAQSIRDIAQTQTAVEELQREIGLLKERLRVEQTLRTATEEKEALAAKKANAEAEAIKRHETAITVRERELIERLQKLEELAADEHKKAEKAASEQKSLARKEVEELAAAEKASRISNGHGEVRDDDPELPAYREESDKAKERLKKYAEQKEDSLRTATLPEMREVQQNALDFKRAIEVITAIRLYWQNGELDDNEQVSRAARKLAVSVRPEATGDEIAEVISPAWGGNILVQNKHTNRWLRLRDIIAKVAGTAVEDEQSRLQRNLELRRRQQFGGR